MSLRTGVSVLDVENYCREKWRIVKKLQKSNKAINLDYTDGAKDMLREVLDLYFGGIKECES